VTTNDATTAGSAGTGPPAGWWNTDFQYRVELVLDIRDLTESLDDFVMLVALDATEIPEPDFAAQGGDDLRFVTVDETELDYELVSLAATTEIWVDVERIEAGPETMSIYLYWGNPGAAPGHNPDQVWDPDDYAGVYHLSDETDASGQADATTGTVTFVQGPIGNVAQFEGNVNSFLQADGSASGGLFQTGGTLMALVLPTGWGQNQQGRIIDRSGNAAINNGWTFNVDNLMGGPRQNEVSTIRFSREYDVGNLHAEATGNPIALDQWWLVAATYDESSDEVHLYVNGEDQNLSMPLPPDGSTGPSLEGDHPLTIGRANDTDPGQERFYEGLIDEVRLTKLIRSPQWMMLEERNLRDLFVTVGPVETLP
jgi:hypothetical protein